MWLPLAWKIVSIRLGRDTFKYFIIFTGKIWHSLWLSSPNSSRLRRFFWRILFFSSVYICSMIIKFEPWVGKSFYTVIPSSAKLCHVARDLLHRASSCRKISLLSKSFCNWTYFVLFKLLSILAYFLKLSLFMYLQRFLPTPAKKKSFTVFIG